MAARRDRPLGRGIERAAAGRTRGEELLLSVRDLHTEFDVEGRKAHAVEAVSFDLARGETLGIVGESGSGKSVTSLSILRLIPDPPGRITKGEILFGGQDLLRLSYEEMRAIRGRQIAMIFQEPMTSLNPVFTIEKQVTEPLVIHEKLAKAAAVERAVEVLDMVGIPDARRRLKDYPHQFSGGMRQRVMIAMALVCRPAILIADEPTTALDVTIQAQILELMQRIQAEREGAGIILITHDLAVIAEMCDRVIVMYGGRIQESAPIQELFDSPLHPYTQGLLASIPRDDRKGQRLHAIPGNVPSIFGLPQGCKFSTRCPQVEARCRTEEPRLIEVAPGHEVRCHLVSAGTGSGAPTGTGSGLGTGTGSGPRTGTGSGGTPPVPVPSPAIPAPRREDVRGRRSSPDSAPPGTAGTP